MKILFAVNNDNISEAIVKKYQKEYKEILSFKNVYYFNAICRELQKDKSYSRIVIGEDLEPFANNNYNSIDKFLFEKYSNIAEEAKDINNNQIDIILICSDRRRRTDDMLIKLYNKGIYNAIIGQDRSIDEVCRLISNPRDKEEAREYYNIKESELGETESETNVSEAEVENIRAHYARLGKNEDKYLESFNNIVAQYNDTQLKIIIKYLPINVKAVLEERSPKYQQLVVSSSAAGTNAVANKIAIKEKTKKQEKNKKNENDFVEKLIKPRNIKNVIVPKAMETSNIQNVEATATSKPEIKTEPIESTQEIVEEKVEKAEPEPQKRGRGRPRKNPIQETPKVDTPKRGRGRPRKNKEPEVDLFNIEEEKPEKQEEPEVDLFNIEEEKPEKQEEPEVDLFNIDEEKPEEQEEPEVDLFNIEEEKPAKQKEPEVDLFNIEEEPEKTISDFKNNIYEKSKYMAKTNNNTDTNFNTLFTSDKKIVAFVGTTKNGTSFVVNNTAEMLSTMGIETAILDLTKNKNAYYIYTNNEEILRETAKNCMINLQNGITEGIKVNKHLTVYTEMPGEEQEHNIEVIMQTLLKRYSAILIDTDFATNPEIFQKVQEIYLVQTMDVLTIQPLTAFLRNLKSNNILQPEKLRIVINKSERVRNLNIRTLIGGMSCYNSPSMTYMTELFNKDNIRYCEIPFETENYVKYLNSLVECSISLKGYTKKFINSLHELANMVYPLINKSNTPRKVEPFSSHVNDTLNKMKNRY